MKQNSEIAQMQGSQHPECMDMPPPGFERYLRTTPATQGSGNAEPSFSPLMLKQMKSMIDGELEGVIDMRLTVMGVNLVIPTSHFNPHVSEGEKGITEREITKMLIKQRIRRSYKRWQQSYL